MKKRVTSLLLAFMCSVLVLLCTSTVLMVDAADKTGLTTALSTVPDESLWANYISTDELKTFVDLAKQLMNEADPSQTMLDYCENGILHAVNSLKPHTKDIKLNITETEKYVGDSFSLSAVLSPAGAADPVEWKSDNAAVTVSSSGEVSVKTYTADVVTVTAVSNGFSGSCKITVKNAFAGVKLKEAASVLETKTVQLTPEAYGTDKTAATTDALTWSWTSSNTLIATVTSTGLVNGLKEGSCVIRATAQSGSAVYFAECEITVKKFKPVTSLQPATVTGVSGIQLTAGESTTFILGILPTNASDPTIKWISSDNSVATVKAVDSSVSALANGLITGVSAGTAKITYMAADGSGVSGSFNVTVKPLISSLSLEDTTFVLNKGQTKQIGYTILPSDAGNQVLKWSSSDSSVCSVDYKGCLSAKSLGICTIYAVTSDGTSLEVSCNVRVASKASTVTVSPSTVNLVTGKAKQLSVTVLTVDGTIYTSPKEVAWKSSDTKIAVVSIDGKVTVKQSGKAIITATAKDGSGVFGLCAVNVTTYVSGVSLPSALKLGVGKTKTLSPSFTPSYATNKAVSWKSSNKSVATVSSAGKITAKAVGTATITCTTADGGYTAKCTVTVVIPVSGIALNKTTAVLTVGNKTKLTATVTPSNATDKTYKWSTSNAKVASISDTGYVKALSTGTAVISATTNDGALVAKCKVTCVQNVTGVELNKTELTCYVGQVTSVKYSVLPESATNKSVSFKSSDATVVSVSDNGTLNALKRGTAVITCKTDEGGYTAKCTVTVVKKTAATGLTFSMKTASLLVGEKAYLKPQVLPENASEQSIKWKTSDKSIAVVNSSGRIAAKGPGKAVITGTTVDGGFTATCTVTVIQKVTGVKLSAEAYSVTVGSTLRIKAIVEPSNASNPAVIWRSTDKAVATVSKTTGKVTGIAPGTAILTCTTADGGFETRCTVTVYQPIKSLTLNKTSVTVCKGNGVFLTPKFTPVNATNQNVTWSSSNRLVAAVSSTGKVTTMIAGTAVISCKSEDGGFVAKCTVKVIQPAEYINLGFETLTLSAGKSKTVAAVVTPETASNKTVKWKSTNTAVATVTKNGVITAVSEGTAKLIVTSGDGYVTVTCMVKVVQPPTVVKLSRTVKKLDVGKSTKLTAIIGPDNAFDKSYTWSTSDASVATVTQDGKVMTHKAGTAVITCTTKVGGCKAECKIIAKIPPKSVSLNRSAMKLNIGTRATLKATVLPATATYKGVTWKSSNSNVAKVSSSGVVTAVAVGVVKITATTKDGGLTASCTVTVPIAVKGIELDRTKVKVGLGKTTTVTAFVLPSTATYDTVIWSSANKKIAKVSSGGVITGTGFGSTVITATTLDGGFVAKCTVTVYQPVTSVKLNTYKRTLTNGSTYTLKATVLPSTAPYRNVTWSSSNTKVAAVSSTGKVTAKAPGTAVITVKTNNYGLKAKCTVTVVQPVTGVKLNKSSANVYVNKTLTLTPTISPSNATNKSVTWKSSNTAVAKVSSKGVVTALKAGTVTITCTTKSSAKTATCKITVLVPVTGVKLNKTARSMAVGGSYSLKATVSPSNASIKTVTWSSSNTKVAVVSSTGKVTAKAPGTAVITVTTKNKLKTAACTVTVTRPVTAVELDVASKTLTVGDSFILTAVISPLNATDKRVTWSSSDTDIAEVSPGGTVTAVAAGSAVISCVTNDGYFRAYCVLTVNPSPNQPPAEPTTQPTTRPETEPETETEPSYEPVGPSE